MMICRRVLGISLKKTSLPWVEYPDFYTAQKVVSTDKIVTIEEINSSNYTVTRWTDETYNFIFRMMGDGWNEGKQDLLLFQVDSFIKDIIEYVKIPVDPNNETNTTNNTNTTNTSITNNTNTTNDTNITNTNTSNNTNINNNTEAFKTKNSTLNNDTILSYNKEDNVINNTHASMKETGLPILFLILVSIISAAIYNAKRKK